MRIILKNAQVYLISTSSNFLKLFAYQIDGVRMPNVSQGAIIEKLIRFKELDSDVAFSVKEKEEIKKGLCQGFSVVHAYMAATEKLT